MNIAIIPARGGSKRILKKNIKDFLGRPIIFYSIDACLEAKIFDKIIVSSDSEEILGIVKNQYGNNIETLERSEMNSSDDASTISVLKEVYNHYDISTSEEDSLDTICCIYPCAPFIKSEWLKECYEGYIYREIYTSAISITKYLAPIEWALTINNDNMLNPLLNNKMLNISSKDCKELYYDAGMFYFINGYCLCEKNTLFTEETLGYILPEKECQDIDTIDDWEYAELKYKILKEINK